MAFVDVRDEGLFVGLEAVDAAAPIAFKVRDGDGNGADLVRVLDMVHKVRSGYKGVRAVAAPMKKVRSVKSIRFGKEKSL